jgi:single-strand DNA-binding protein
MNYFNIIGFLGKDPEERFTSNNQKLTSFSIACGKDENTFWVKCTVWGDHLEKMLSFIKKGSLVYVVGELKKPRTYQDKQGQTQVSLEVTVRDISFVPSSHKKEVSQTTQEDLPF